MPILLSFSFVELPPSAAPNSWKSTSALYDVSSLSQRSGSITTRSLSIAINL